MLTWMVYTYSRSGSGRHGREHDGVGHGKTREQTLFRPQRVPDLVVCDQPSEGRRVFWVLMRSLRVFTAGGLKRQGGRRREDEVLQLHGRILGLHTARGLREDGTNGR